MSPAACISYRKATRDDMAGILAVEQSWHEDGRAGADKFEARMARFGAGFFVVLLTADGSQKIIATVTSMPWHYDPARPEHFRTWDEVTNNGYLFDRAELAGCNALYIVSGVIDKAHRGLNIFKPGVMRIVMLAAAMGMRYVVAGAVIPGYRRFQKQRGAIDAYQYCVTRVGNHLADPLLALYESIGFRVPDRRHVIEGYYPDDASHNYAALVRRDLLESPL